jgi:hypothetical protein
MHSGVDQYAVQSYETAAHERILVDVPVFGFYAEASTKFGNWTKKRLV